MSFQEVKFEGYDIAETSETLSCQILLIFESCDFKFQNETKKIICFLTKVPDFFAIGFPYLGS